MPNNPWDADKDFDLSLNASQAKPKPWETDSDFEGTGKPFGEDKIPVTDIARMVGRGIPIAGRYIDETPEMKGYAQRHPWTAKGLEWGGTAASTIPAALATAYATGPGLIAAMFGQGMLSGGLTLGDRAAEKGISNLGTRDVTDSLISGGIGTLGPIGGRLLSHKLPMPEPPPPTILENIIAARGGKIPGFSGETLARAVPPKLPVNDGSLSPMMESVIKTLKEGGAGAVSGTILGDMAFGHHGAAGALLGMSYPLVKSAVKAAYPYMATSSKMNEPMNQAILAAIAQQAGRKMTAEDEPIQ